MPPAGEALRQHAAIAGHEKRLATVLQALFLVPLLGVAAGWRPSRRAATLGIALPCLSTAVVALGYGNPFDATFFASLAAALAALGRRLPAESIRPRSSLASIVGAGVAVSGWAHPGFLAAVSGPEILYRAPAGLLPGPTLALALGLSIASSGFGSRAWTLLLGAAGGFYGLHGALRLGVTSDLVLFAGALVSVGLHGRATSRAASPPAAAAQRPASCARRPDAARSS